VWASSKNQRVANFQNVLSDQLEEFQKANGKRPTQPEVQAMISRLLMPIVITTPGAVYGTNSKNGFQFEGNTLPEGATVSTGVKIADVPSDVRAQLADYLERNYRRKPTDAEIVGAYVRFKNGT
jgi:hypothetical protein